MKTDRATLDDRLALIGRQPFRAKFHLRAPEREFVALRGMDVVRAHAVDFIGQRPHRLGGCQLQATGAG